MKTTYKNIAPGFKLRLLCGIFIFFQFTSNATFSQCPDNIDFEKGDFSGWLIYKSTFRGGFPLVWNAPVIQDSSRHKILINSPGHSSDYYGGFPKSTPNGSGHSVKLGNDLGRGQADKITYRFTVPINKDTFNLIYNYALVLQDPGHAPDIQPRFAVEVFNVTDNEPDDCSSLIFIMSRAIPGFYLSDKTPQYDTSVTPVWCKDWAAASINLNGKAGKTLDLSFYVTACGYNAHFGYMYLDINNECDGSLKGSVFCDKSEQLRLTAPFGYQQYEWYKYNFSQLLGTGQELSVSRAQVTDNKVALILTPYFGYGCVDTLFVKLFDTLSIKVNAGPDRTSCFNDSLQIGSPPKPDVKYSWTPTTGLSNPDISFPLASPIATTTYFVTASNEDGKCFATDSVKVIRPCTVSEIFVPNAFTPNRDGVNDLLRPLITGPDKMLSFRIYNRSGQLLFATNNDKNGWDGTFKNKSLGTQTVVWVVQAIKRNGEIYHEKGTTILIR